MSAKLLDGEVWMKLDGAAVSEFNFASSALVFSSNLEGGLLTCGHTQATRPECGHEGWRDT